MADEEKFERTIAILGRLLRDDLQLQALYHMLVMMTPSPRAPAEVQADPVLIKVQVKLCQLIYRYLSNASLEASSSSPTSEASEPGSAIMRLASHEESSGLSPDEKTRLLISMLDTLHDCAEIMLYRSLSLDGWRYFQLKIISVWQIQLQIIAVRDIIEWTDNITYNIQEILKSLSEKTKEIFNELRI